MNPSRSQGANRRSRSSCSELCRSGIAWAAVLLIGVVVSPAALGAPLYVLDPVYATKTLDAEPSDTVENVKAKVQDKYSPSLSVAPDARYLYFGNQLLEDGRTLSDYPVPSGTTLTLVSTAAFSGTPLPNTLWNFGIKDVAGGGR